MRYTKLRQLNLVWCTDFSAWKVLKTKIYWNDTILKFASSCATPLMSYTFQFYPTSNLIKDIGLDIVERQVYLGILRHLWPPRNPFSSWSQNYNQTGIFAEMGWAKCFISHAKQGSAGDIWILPCVSRAALQKRCIISQLLALPLLLWYFKRM